MASAAVFWNYQRKLSFNGNQNDPRESEEMKERTRRRLESTVSVTYNNDEERRDSTASAGDSTDDEALNADRKTKGRRKFSLDFLFSRRKSKDKACKKSKRSQSTITQAGQEPYKCNGAEFALAM